MRTTTTTIGALFALLCLPSATQGSLLTDLVDFNFVSECDPQAASQVLVVADGSFAGTTGENALSNSEFVIGLGSGLSSTATTGTVCQRSPSQIGVNMNAESLTLTAVGAQTMLAGESLEVTGLDWVGFADGHIVGVEVTGDFGGTTPDVSYGPHSVSIDFMGASSSDLDSFSVILNAVHTPEPGALALLSMGLVGLVLRVRRQLHS